MNATSLPKKTKQPPAIKKPTLRPDVLELFHENLGLMREWYRQQPGRGVEMGHLVLLELCLADVIAALNAAMYGKTWQPPST